MPSTVTHGLIAGLLVSLIVKEKSYWRLAFITGTLPDLDGIPVLYDYVLFHRVHHELFHPPIYGVILGVLGAYCLSFMYGMRKRSVFLVVAFSFASHSFVDVFFTDWYVKLLWPLSSFKFSYPYFVAYYHQLFWVISALAVIRLLIDAVLPEEIP